MCAKPALRMAAASFCRRSSASMGMFDGLEVTLKGRGTIIPATNRRTRGPTVAGIHIHYVGRHAGKSFLAAAKSRPQFARLRLSLPRACPEPAHVARQVCFHAARSGEHGDMERAGSRANAQPGSRTNSATVGSFR